jgi:hypothetical protein
VSLTPVPLLLEWGIHTLTLQIVDGPASPQTIPHPCLTATFAYITIFCAVDTGT